jgi:hypothetical protein
MALQLLSQGIAFDNPATSGSPLKSLMALRSSAPTGPAYNEFLFALDSDTDPNLLQIKENHQEALVNQADLNSVPSASDTYGRGLGYQGAVGGSAGDILISHSDGLNCEVFSTEDKTFSGADNWLNDIAGGAILKDGASFLSATSLTGPDEVIFIDETTGLLSVIDDITSSGAVSRTITLPDSSLPVDLAFDEDGSRLVVLADNGKVYYYETTGLDGTGDDPVFTSVVKQGSIVPSENYKIVFNRFADVSPVIDRLTVRTGPANQNTLSSYAYNRFRIRAKAISPRSTVLVGGQKGFEVVALFEGSDGEEFGAPFNPPVSCKVSFTGTPNAKLARDANGTDLGTELSFVESTYPLQFYVVSDESNVGTDTLRIQS